MVRKTTLAIAALLLAGPAFAGVSQTPWDRETDGIGVARGGTPVMDDATSTRRSTRSQGAPVATDGRTEPVAKAKKRTPIHIQLGR